MSRSCLSSLVLSAVLAAGCAMPAPDAPAHGSPADPGARWLLTWHRALPAGAEALAHFEAEASAIAGLPVRRVAAVSDRVVAVTLACDTTARCAEAQARLRRDPRVAELAPDARRRTLSP